MNIVFDFGVVLFTWQPVKLLMQAFPHRADTPLAAGQLAHEVFGHADWHNFDRGVLEIDEVVTRTSQRLALPVHVLGKLVRGIGDHLTPVQETVALLSQLRRRRLAGDGISGLYYLSNMPVVYARVLEERHDFLRWFDGGIFSGDVKHVKPDLAIYQLLQSRYALQPAQTLFIDDLKKNVDMARTLGWQGIHFESPQQLASELAELGLHPGLDR